MTKRILAVLLAAMMLLSLATACGTSGSEDANSKTDEVVENIDLSTKRNVTIAISQNTFITDYEDNLLTQKLEEDYNCDITMSVLPAGNDGLSKLQLMINGGDDLPDVFSFGLTPALMYQYGSNGTFVALNNYYDNPVVMPNFNAIESEEDKMAMKSAATSADGNLYCLTKFEPEPWNLTPYRIYLNMKWLDNLGLKQPTTVDELHDVLVAFRKNDPNGNGKQDEIPMLANYVDNGGYGCNTITALMSSFTYVPVNMSGLAVDESGKNVIAPQTTEGWKEGLKYLHKLYEDEAILPNGSFIYGTDTTGFKGTLNYQGNGTETAPDGKSVNIVGLFSAGSNTGNFAGSNKDENPNFMEFRMVAPFKNGAKDGYSPYTPYDPGRFWFVTDAAEDPAFCTLLGDSFYDFEMSIAGRYGAKDIDWTNDEKFCADWYATHTKLIEEHAEVGAKQTKKGYKWVVTNQKIWHDNTNHFWHNNQPRYMSMDNFSNYYGKDYYEDLNDFKYYYGNTLIPTSEELFGSAHPKYNLPVLTYIDEEQSQITEFQVAYPDAILEWTMRFITGELDVDKDWDSYVDALNGLGLETYIECSQAAYERTVYYQSNFQ